jgi:hypothetical protein
MGKGGDFEREVSKTLTVWLTGKEKPYKYWRMPGSGGLATIHEECADLSGDIRSLSRDGDFLTDAFSIECKTGYPKTSFWQHFKHLKGFHIKLFWKQAVEDALKPRKRPMLIYRKKGKQIIIGVCRTDKKHLENLSEGLRTLAYISMRFELDELPEIVFYDFKEFFAAVTPEEMQKFQDFLRTFSQ